MTAPETLECALGRMRVNGGERHIHLECYPRHTLDPLGLKEDSQRCHRHRVRVTAIEFHNALESRHGYGRQTPHSP